MSPSIFCHIISITCNNKLFFHSHKRKKKRKNIHYRDSLTVKRRKITFSLEVTDEIVAYVKLFGKYMIKFR